MLATAPEICNEAVPTAGRPHTKAVAAVSLFFVVVFVAGILREFGYPAALTASYVVLPVVGKSAACVCETYCTTHQGGGAVAGVVLKYQQAKLVSQSRPIWPYSSFARLSCLLCAVPIW